MLHTDHLKESGARLPESFIINATGRYYTHPSVAKRMSKSAIDAWRRQIEKKAKIRLIDPFGGDGRLAAEFIRSWANCNRPLVSWNVTLWDINKMGLSLAEEALKLLQDELHIDITWDLVEMDSFTHTHMSEQSYDVVITNPPWEQLKPDRRELKSLTPDVVASYVEAMRDYDAFLADAYPLAQPSRKFAGWGTNLSRVGFDLCQSLLAKDGLMAIVMPASFMADDLSLELRKQVLETCTVHEITYYPAESKLYGSADVPTITMVLEPSRFNGQTPKITLLNKSLEVASQRQIELNYTLLKNMHYVVPVSFGGEAVALLERLNAELPTWSELEGPSLSCLWAGRELDETRSRQWLSPDADGPFFIKGRMIDRFRICESPSLRVGKKNLKTNASVSFNRIAWRDVSRPNQKRRLIATVIPKGVVAGNSLGIAYFRDSDELTLHSLLGVMSSLVFEFQLRCHLSTGHVSLSSIRRVRVPTRAHLETLISISREVELLLETPNRCQARLEALVAKQAYSLTASEFESVLNAFDKVTELERKEILEEYKQVSLHTPKEKYNHDDTTVPNHLSGRLSELDMSIVLSVPEGGNWKDIPNSIPSQRIAQIRESFKRGEGSRSTYYGRLRNDMPSYTINTYFNRPGNGCHIHPTQNRVLSQREAARLQSFPDNFEFIGPQGIVNKQIGNAVPPLLAYQVAGQLGTPGVFVDLFSGAGGLGLGFSWAGWLPIVANDIEPRFLETYRKNIHDCVVLGSIADSQVRGEIVERANQLRADHPDKPFWVLGGPPCQGFSTAGHRRTMKDERNHLFWDYCKILEELQPDGFVFENVVGLLNMQQGRVFEMVKEAFESVMPKVNGWLLSADEYAVPQRRKRVFLIGSTDVEICEPPKLTNSSSNGELFSGNELAISVSDAIGDLPSLSQGQDGSRLPYPRKPLTAYQALMRGQIGPTEYLTRIHNGQREWNER